MNHWTQQERDLAQDKSFVLLVCFGDNSDVSYYVYEKHDILKRMIDLQAEYIHDGLGYQSYDVVDVNIYRGPFLVIDQNTRGRPNVAYFETELEATFTIKDAKRLAKENCYDSLCFASWVYVNLQDMRPYFLSETHIRAKEIFNGPHFTFFHAD